MPAITVLYGQPTPEELAAVVAVFTARSHAATAASRSPVRRRPVSAWADPATAMRQPLPAITRSSPRW
ncbi:acyl-CoA carboxylase subunit epsilon [Streptomyces sporangiiformans]|uniref:Acyl-CoA carboxylase subunit epsilon n=1 Tax=Streptomyces sporangiiformans TaxID=2315329 RepID=A0A505DN91_9ACTN|nr:acyl-CoA carboxylase subunit epsilon [Streptomyces sporangiiformans]TPQ21551.1 acyl-CoA carboxylase subunit epsilon [Streptomyces sporangiiformans]